MFQYILLHVHHLEVVQVFLMVCNQYIIIIMLIIIIIIMLFIYLFIIDFMGGFSKNIKITVNSNINDDVCIFVNIWMVV